MGEVVMLRPPKESDFFPVVDGGFVGVTVDVEDFYGGRVGGYSVMTPNEARALARELLRCADAAEGGGE